MTKTSTPDAGVSRDAEEIYRLVTEHSLDILFALDSSGVLVFLNNRARELCGLDRIEWTGKHFSELPFAGYPQRALSRKRGKAALRSIMRKVREIVLVPSPGVRFILEVRIVEAPGDGEIFAHGVARDVTGTRTINRQLLLSEKLSSLSGLVAGVAHELNNPLTSVLGYAELLRSDRFRSGCIKQDLERIISEAGRARTIIQNLLVFAGQNPSEKRPTDLNELIETVLDAREFEMSLNHIETVCVLDRRLPRIEADSQQMRQVFLCILNNAIHAMKRSGRERRLTVTTRLDHTSIRIIFQDTGPGISEDHLHKIFDPFFTTLETGKGIGLGLSIAYGIVHEHGGMITVSAEKDEGARFVIELPISVALPCPSLPAEPAGYGSTLPAIRVLVLDAEDEIALFMKRVLVKEGCVVTTVKTREDALGLLAGHSFDVFIADVRTCAPDLQSALVWFEKRSPALLERTIFMTETGLNLEEQTLLRGAHALDLRKPFTVHELMRTLEVRSSILT